MNNTTAYILIGPQGCGKGTQAEILSKKHGFSVFVMGDLLREESHKDTERAQKIQKLMMEGELVPDSLIFDILDEHFSEATDKQIALFDGFPRTINQAKALDQMITVKKAILIELSDAVSIERIKGRNREDDTDEAVKRRLEIYKQETEKVLEYYKGQGKLVTVDGEPPIPKVTEQIESHILDVS